MKTDATKLMLDRIISWEKDLSEYESLEGILREQFIIQERKEYADNAEDYWADFSHVDRSGNRVISEANFKAAIRKCKSDL